jgi:phage shock protein PspC (stress-responsive transcriptional regulator)
MKNAKLPATPSKHAVSSNFFINLGIIAGLDYYFGISPYIGQFVSAAFFTLWTFGGLKYWVFHRPLRAKKRRAH